MVLLPCIPGKTFNEFLFLIAQTRNIILKVPNAARSWVTAWAGANSRRERIISEEMREVRDWILLHQRRDALREVPEVKKK